MNDKKYDVKFISSAGMEETLAEVMDLDVAVLLIKAVTEEYCEDMRYGAKIILCDSKRFEMVEG